jgi:hypothetical protein
MEVTERGAQATSSRAAGAVRFRNSAKIAFPCHFVETNAFWCRIHISLQHAPDPVSIIAHFDFAPRLNQPPLPSNLNAAFSSQVL